MMMMVGPQLHWGGGRSTRVPAARCSGLGPGLRTEKGHRDWGTHSGQSFANGDCREPLSRTSKEGNRGPRRDSGLAQGHMCLSHTCNSAPVPFPCERRPLGNRGQLEPRGGSCQRKQVSCHSPPRSPHAPRGRWAWGPGLRAASSGVGGAPAAIVWGACPPLQALSSARRFHSGSVLLSLFTSAAVHPPSASTGWSRGAGRSPPPGQAWGLQSGRRRAEGGRGPRVGVGEGVSASGPSWASR